MLKAAVDLYVVGGGLLSKCVLCGTDIEDDEPRVVAWVKLSDGRDMGERRFHVSCSMEFSKCCKRIPAVMPELFESGVEA